MSIKEVACKDRNCANRKLAEEIANIIHLAFGFRFPPIITPYQICNRMADSDYRVYCYFGTGMVLGVVFFYEPEHLIEHLCVLPWYQGREIGKALLNCAIDNHGPYLQLVVKNTNEAAISLYRKHGFIRTGSKGPAAVRMERKLQLHA